MPKEMGVEELMPAFMAPTISLLSAPPDIISTGSLPRRSSRRSMWISSVSDRSGSFQSAISRSTGMPCSSSQALWPSWTQATWLGALLQTGGDELADFFVVFDQ